MCVSDSKEVNRCTQPMNYEHDPQTWKLLFWIQMILTFSFNVWLFYITLSSFVANFINIYLGLLCDKKSIHNYLSFEFNFAIVLLVVAVDAVVAVAVVVIILLLLELLQMRGYSWYCCCCWYWCWCLYCCCHICSLTLFQGWTSNLANMMKKRVSKR